MTRLAPPLPLLSLPLLSLPLITLALLSLATPAHAGRKAQRARQAEETSADTGQDGTAKAAAASRPKNQEDPSIWDWIEAAEEPGADPAPGDAPDGGDQIATTASTPKDESPELPIDADAVEASAELAASRDSEASVLSQAARYNSPIDFYVDPRGTLDHDPLHLRDVDPAEFDIPMVVNDDVVKWMEYFTGRGRKYYSRYLSRSTMYRPMMRAKLRAAGLPEDLVYLSMIESGYNTHAYSHAAAAGLWQFITSTGKMYDLRVDFWVDQRRDPLAATDAAIRLLGDLYQEYGDWYLAWAAYNGGPGRVNRALRAHGKVDFWTLAQKHSFRTETDNYVPKLLAAAIIGKHPERYGFVDIDYQQPEEIDAVKVGSSIGLDVLAKCAGVSETEFQRINPQLRRWALPPSPTQQTIYLPAGTGETFLAKLDKVPPERRLTFVHHKVKKGETLGSIASRYHVALRDVQSTNRIRNANRIYPGMDLIIPRPGTTPPAALTSIAGGSSSSSRKSRSTHSRSTSKVHTITHTVRKGETLSTIARTYGVRQSDLQRWNGIKNANRVLVGQHLKVRTTAPSWTSYRVKSGDTLSGIARRYKVDVDDLRSWNHISGSRILVGQHLKIRS
ncbi:MAG: LysM peptidoglycan-binding domain-containing protein [Oligoflexia bacterium]|nr:LysM peptidoglycan-binding domain-containing protein [Oligoflexia bacterium]